MHNVQHIGYNIIRIQNAEIILPTCNSMHLYTAYMVLSHIISLMYAWGYIPNVLCTISCKDSF